MFGANLVDAQHQADLCCPSSVDFLALLLLLRGLLPGTVGIHAPFDLGQPLLVCMDHLDDPHHSAYNDGDDRNQQSTQSKEVIEEVLHVSPSTELPIFRRSDSAS